MSLSDARRAAARVINFAPLLSRPLALLFVCLCLPAAACTEDSNTTPAGPAVMAALHRTLGGHAEVVWQVAFSPDSRWLAPSGYDKTVKLWRLEGAAPPE